MHRLALLATLAGCAPPSPNELGALSMPKVVTARDGGAAAAIGGRMLWTFGDTLMTTTSVDGWSYRSATAAWGDGASLRLDEPLDANGAPLQLLPYSDDEAAYNRAHGPEERYALWPGSVIADGAGGALVFYEDLLVHPGALNYQQLGAGVARLAAGSTVAARDPGLLFAPPAPGFNVGGVTSGGFVYVYACDPVPGVLDTECRVARAPLPQADRAGAWSTWDGAAWSSDLTAGRPVFHGAPGDLSVSWNQAAGAFLAVHSAIFSDDVVLHTAPAPEGPWSDPRPLFRGAPPPSGNDYAAKEHPELARDGGRTLVVSYARPLGGFDGELRLALPSLP